MKANAAIVPAGAAGAISVYASDTTELVLDIDGYFQAANDADAAVLSSHALPRVRHANQQGHLGGRTCTARASATSRCCGATARSRKTRKPTRINFTVVPWQGKPLGYLSVWAAGRNQPVVSTLNNPTATVVANAAIVPAGVGGAIAVYPDQDTDLVADIDGYFAAPGDGGLSLYPTAPCRVLDTRSNGGAFHGATQSARECGGQPVRHSRRRRRICLQCDRRAAGPSDT